MTGQVFVYKKGDANDNASIRIDGSLVYRPASDLGFLQIVTTILVITVSTANVNISP